MPPPKTDFAAQRDSGYAAYPRVHLVMESNETDAANALGDIVSNDCGHLLAASKDNLFLIRPVRNAPNVGLDAFVLAAKQVALVRIRSDAGSCP